MRYLSHATDPTRCERYVRHALVAELMPIGHSGAANRVTRDRRPSAG